MDHFAQPRHHTLVTRVRQTTPDRQERLELDLGSWQVTEEFVAAYLEAVGDGSPVCFQHRLAPPLALAARGLGGSLEKLELPPGAIHSVQEIETKQPIPFGGQVTGKAVVGPSRRRGDMELLAVNLSLKDANGSPALESKSTVLVLDRSSEATATSERPAREEKVSAAKAGGHHAQDTALPAVARTISQTQLNAYAEVSGDRNPLHLDAAFAASTMFGGIIAHGMLTLAFISEMMALKFDRAWLETGGLKVRFKGAARPGDRVETRGTITKEEPASSGLRLTCSVAAHEPEQGQELITGSATVELKKT